MIPSSTAYSTISVPKWLFFGNYFNFFLCVDIVRFILT